MMDDEGKQAQTGATIEIQPITNPAGPSSESVDSSGHEQAGPSNRKRSVHFKLFGADIFGETEDDDDDEKPAAKAIRTETKRSPLSGDFYSEDGHGNIEEEPYTGSPLFFTTTFTTQSPPPFIEFLPSKPRPLSSCIDYRYGTSGGSERLGWDWRILHGSGGYTTVGSVPPPTLVEYLPPKDFAVEDFDLLSLDEDFADFFGKEDMGRQFDDERFLLQMIVNDGSDNRYDSETASNSTPPRKVC